MEPSHLPPPPGQPSSPGELVVQNGRSSGARRALNDPLTLIGQASGCDIRVSAEGVEALHCAVLLDPAGPILRDLGSAAGTRVNGRPVTVHRLVNGDVIEVGPSRFTFQGTPATAEVPAAGVVLNEREREALRIQAAAVVAQQAALGEEEARLDQRAGALTRQEEQLAGHLEQRQRRLDDQEAAAQAERAAHAAEADAQRRAIEAERLAVERSKGEAGEERDKLGKERQRLKALRRRLLQRFKRDWSAKESALARRESELAAGLDRLNRERARVKAFHERVNTERELGRRQLKEEWQELGLAQQQWEQTLNLERADQERQKRELQLLAAEASAARDALLAQQREADAHKARLGREAEGLEARIAHQRARLEAVERDLNSRLAAASVPPSAEPIIPPSVSPPPSLPPAQIVRITEELMDQRSRLAEQWERFLQVQQTWEQDRRAVLGAMEGDVARLDKREQKVKQGEQELAAARSHLGRQRELIARLRAATEGGQARLAIEQSEWVARRDALLADLDARERALTLRGQHLEEIHRRRHERRQQEVSRQTEARARADEARRQYSALWQDCERLREEWVRQERVQANRALALERYRQELIQQSPDSAQAEARLARLERDESARGEDEAWRIEEQRRLLLDEHRKLDELAARLRRQEDTLAETLRQWEDAQGRRESLLAAEREADARLQTELRRLRAQHAIDERQLRQVREELERVARVLIEEGGEVPAAA